MVGAEAATAQELRAKFEAARESGSPSEVRAAAVDYYRARSAEGGTQPEVASELGLKRWTLAKWHQKHEVEQGESSGKQTGPEQMSVEGAALKAEVERLGPRSPSRRFPEELKERVAQWAHGEFERGVSLRVIANQLGIPWETISRWLGRRAESVKPVPKIRAVRVVDGPPASVESGPRGLVLKSVHGFCIEGLDVATLVEVLRGLG